MLTLEINESALTNNVNFVHETLANLRNEGISLSPTTSAPVTPVSVRWCATRWTS